MLSRWCLLWFIVLLFLTAAVAQPPVRPSATALRVPDGAIIVDGRDDDWQRAGEALKRCRSVSNDPKLLTFINTDRGVYQGTDDFSLETWLAADSANLYILADVHDQALFNDAGAADIYAGDDFEVYIDSNLPAAQFAKEMNENVRQLIFEPAFVNPAFPNGLIWQVDQCPGVTMASRLRPWGYTIEIKIPKALFPNWKAHPEQDTVGLDFQINDADSPGLDGPHTSNKYAGFLLSPAAHFMSPQELGVLKVEAKPIDLTPAAIDEALGKKGLLPDDLMEKIKAANEQNAESLAQAVLDNIAGERAADIATVALASKERALHKAGLVILAKRPQLPAPIEALQTTLEPKFSGYGELGEAADLVNYGLVALAERGKLPAKRWFGGYSRVADPQVRLTFVWCLGANGDREIIPDLAKLLYDGNLRVRIKAAMALGQLRDPAALPALEEMVANDPHHYARGEATNSIALINK